MIAVKRDTAVRVLILCAGNIGRSPLAEVMLRDAVADRLGVAVAGLRTAGVAIASAGTSAPEGHPASVRGIAIAADLELDLTGHKATLLTKAALDEADRVYGMDNDQLIAVSETSPDAVAKTVLWAGEGGEIADPHHQSDEFFRDVFSQIHEALPVRTAEVVAMIAQRGGV